MRITGLHVQIFAPRPNAYQETPREGASPTRQNGIGIILTDEGIEGVVSSTSELLRWLARLWRDAAAELAGQDPFDRERIARLLSRRFGWPQRVLGVLDCALWDIAGKALGLPVYKLLGAARDRVRAYASTVHHATDERYLETALASVERGFQAVKLHPYGAVADDIRLCGAVRQAVGDGVTLMMDALTHPNPVPSYDRADALRAGRALEELNFWWFEDPLPKTDLDGLAELARSCQAVQVRMSDRVEHISEYVDMLRRGCLDIMAGPPSFGITELMKLARLAEAHGLRMEPHSFGPIGGGAAVVHVLLAIHNADYYEVAVPEGCLDTAIYPGVYLDPVRVGPDGYLSAPTKPGLGFEIDRHEADRVTVERL